MIPIYGRQRLSEVQKFYEASEPMPFAGGHYVITSIKYDVRTERGSFDVQEVMLVDQPEADASVRDAVRTNQWEGV